MFSWASSATCRSCGGTGQETMQENGGEVDKECSTCGGSGEVEVEEYEGG